MAATRVISLRIPSKTLAQITYILEASNLDPTRLSMSSSVRKLVEAVVEQYVLDGALARIETDEEAEERLTEVFGNGPGMVGVVTPKADRFKPPNVHEPVDACEPELEVEHDLVPMPLDTELSKDEIEAMRDKIHANLDIPIAEAKAQIDAKRFFGVGGGAKDRVPSAQDEFPYEDADTPAPWEGEEFAEPEAVLELAESLPWLKQAVLSNNQAVLLAARNAIKQLPREVLMGDTGKGVVRDIARIYLDWVGSDTSRALHFPETKLPKTKKPSGVKLTKEK